MRGSIAANRVIMLAGVILVTLFAIIQVSNVAFRGLENSREAQAKGKGAASLDGKMIDIAMYRMGLETIAKAEGLEKRARHKEGRGLKPRIPGEGECPYESQYD